MSEEYDEELEAIRERKAAELQRRLEEEKRKRELESKREALLRSILTQEARERLYNISLVKPELARAIEDYIIQLVSAGRLSVPVGDEIVKRLLAEMDERTRKDYKITFKRKGGI